MSEDERPTRGVCRRNVGDLPAGTACPDCGHSGWLHPISGNGITACVPCDLLAVGAEVVADIKAAARDAGVPR